MAFTSDDDRVAIEFKTDTSIETKIVFSKYADKLDTHAKKRYRQKSALAITGGKLRFGHVQMIRLYINKGMDESRMFAIWRIEQLWKPITKKGIGLRMGSGKGPIDHYVFPVKANRMILEVGGKCEYKEVFPFLNRVAQILPFKARVVSHEILAKDKEEEKRIEENNINPFTFHDSIRKNYLGCSEWVSPYDYIYHGKYR